VHQLVGEILIGEDLLQLIVPPQQEKMETAPLAQEDPEIEQMMAALLAELAMLAQ
jgi:hypothetical protein